jgi:hypothetical protein
VSREYPIALRPSVESLVGPVYATSYVLTRLAKRREAFEREVRAALGSLAELGEVWVTRRDEALIGRR